MLVDFQTRADALYIEALKRVRAGALRTFAFGESTYHAGCPWVRQFKVLADDPNNPLGEYWIGLGDKLALHGTNDPGSLHCTGGPGTIRLANQDVRDVYGILSIGSRVVVQRIVEAGDLHQDRAARRIVEDPVEDRVALGRLADEPEHEYRTAFQRDRDRIIHSTAFRRLMYKTQVFVNHEGDLYRTRLTHSLEVSQIGRSVAVALGLNEALTEAICLAHDLGHTPFGHAGQDTLNACMRNYGGFEHNLQSLRVVDELEAKYAAFPGLNLMFETREGILKHCSARNARELGELGKRFLERRQPGLEAQIANLADAIAYNNHDVDDGFRAGLLSLEQLREQSLFEYQYREVHRRYPDLEDRRLIYEIIRRMIGKVVSDMIAETQRQVEAAGVGSIDDVRNAGKPLVNMSPGVYEQHIALKRFLNKHLYGHEKKLEMTRRAQAIVADLFAAYSDDVSRMPPEFAEQAGALDEAGRARVIADYIAGMTDRFAIRAHEALAA